MSELISRRGSYRRDAGPSQRDDNAINKDVDGATLEFIQKYLTSYTKWEVLKHFVENPATIESPKGFARRLGKDVRQISEAMKSLARTGILTNGHGSEDGGYSLTADATQMATLQRTVDMARANNRFRLLLNYHITKASLAKYRSRI